MTNQITDEQIKETETYKQAVKIAELVVIPELSEEAETYFLLLNDYREITGNLNSSGFGRFTQVSTYEYKPNLDEFDGNLKALEDIETNLILARNHHALIVQAVMEGLHEKALNEEQARWTTNQAKLDIVRNAYKVARTNLEEQAKDQVKREKARERAITKNILKAN